MNPPEFACHWARELGTAEATLVKLRGGINNHVYRCGTHGRDWVIKGYPTLQAGQRDRMQAEVEFLRYAHQVAPGRVPELIAVDSQRRCVVLENLEGETYPEGISPTVADLRAAMLFFQQLNEDLSLAREMIHLDAAEGFLSLRQHMVNVRERLAAMVTDHLPTECMTEAAALLASLHNQADAVEADLERQIGLATVEDLLSPEFCCVSPSDFGFHNAINTDQGLRFIDFEFAGWDDPTKAAVDFMLQPRVPVSRTYAQLVNLSMISDDCQLNHRAVVIMPILRLKWLCIICSVLRPERLVEIMSVSAPNLDPVPIVTSRLARAKMLFSSYC